MGYCRYYLEAPSDDTGIQQVSSGQPKCSHRSSVAMSSPDAQSLRYLAPLPKSKLQPLQLQTLLLFFLIFSSSTSSTLSSTSHNLPNLNLDLLKKPLKTKNSIIRPLRKPNVKKHPKSKTAKQGQNSTCHPHPTPSLTR